MQTSILETINHREKRGNFRPLVYVVHVYVLVSEWHVTGNPLALEQKGVQYIYGAPLTL